MIREVDEHPRRRRAPKLKPTVQYRPLPVSPGDRLLAHLDDDIRHPDLILKDGPPQTIEPVAPPTKGLVLLRPGERSRVDRVGGCRETEDRRIGCPPDRFLLRVGLGAPAGPPRARSPEEPSGPNQPQDTIGRVERVVDLLGKAAGDRPWSHFLHEGSKDDRLILDGKLQPAGVGQTIRKRQALAQAEIVPHGGDLPVRVACKVLPESGFAVEEEGRHPRSWPQRLGIVHPGAKITPAESLGHLDQVRSRKVRRRPSGD